MDGEEGEDLEEDLEGEAKVEVEGGVEEADVTMLKALMAFLLWLVLFASDFLIKETCSQQWSMSGVYGKCGKVCNNL
jgi:hypothetical protein